MAASNPIGRPSGAAIIHPSAIMLGAANPNSTAGEDRQHHSMHAARTKIAFELANNPTPAATPLQNARPRHAR